jgi:hypothetical protein
MGIGMRGERRCRPPAAIPVQRWGERIEHDQCHKHSHDPPSEGSA